MNTPPAFPDEAYAAARQGVRGAGVREEEGRRRMSELELQARIAGGQFGVRWRGEDGETIEVVHFGAWNREPGPDFSGARILINGEVFEGDLEIDGEARDWESHGHAGNPAYKDVILHVFFRRGSRRLFTRTFENRVVPQVCLETAVPSVRSQKLTVEAVLEEPQARALIEAAARFRLQRKGGAFRRAAELGGWDQALFQALAVGMGYKNNKIPFLLVAQRAGLARAREADGEALLFGLAGFLKAGDFDESDEESRGYLRGLWEGWWRIRAREGRLVLPDDAWKLAGIRPANHPHRRLGALAVVAARFPELRRTVEAHDEKNFSRSLGSMDHEFWRCHASLARDRLPREMAVIGPDRVRDLVINAFLSALPFSEGWEKLRTLAGAPPNRKVLSMTGWLCGAERPALARTALDQQGLLQLHEDFFPVDPQTVWRAFVDQTRGA